MVRLGKNPFCPKRGLIRMSWNKRNLYNAEQYAKSSDNTFNKTVFQTRYRAKQLARGYHGSGVVTEHQFNALFEKKLPAPPPSLLPSSDRRGTSLSANGSKPMPEIPPVSSLTMGFLERRADITLFRACLAPSLYAARHMIRKRWVHLNGRVLTKPSLKLEDGDTLRIVRQDVIHKMIGASPAQIADMTKKSASAKEADTEEETRTETTEEKQDATRAVETKDEAAVIEAQLQGEAENAQQFTPRPFSQPWMFVPEYLDTNFNTLSVCFLRSPTVKPGKCEIPTPFPPPIHGLVYEYYARR